MLYWCARFFFSPLNVTIYSSSQLSATYLFILMEPKDHDSPPGSTLSMSFQHFSTIFLSTTAGWWGWGGCWCGWKASFIKPMRPAPLLGFPAINTAGGRAFAPGVFGGEKTGEGSSWRAASADLSISLRQCLLSCRACCRGEQNPLCALVGDEAS